MSRARNVTAQPSVEFLNKGHIQEIHNAAMRILERTGVVVHHEDVVEMLRGAGCSVADDKRRVRMPAELVEEAARTTPAAVDIFDRQGQLAMVLKDRNSYWGTGSDTPFVFDSFTGQRRQSCLEDVRKVSALIDVLENYDFLMCMGVAHELPQTIADKHHFLTMVTTTTKPLVFTASSEGNLADIYDMACQVAGGEDVFKRKPFIMHYTEPIAPLIHPKDSLDKMLFCVRHGIPVIYTSATTAGQNGPVTLAGSLAMSVARILSGLVIGQLAQKGASMIVTMHGSSMEPRNAIHTYASPEHVLFQAAAKSLSEHYQLPTFGRAGTTEAKIPDQQAAFEAGYEILMHALCGENLIHDVGYLESGLTGSWDMVVMCNEFIGAAKRVARGFEVSEEAFALDLIDTVGPEGQFMDEMHTAENYRKEFWMPELLDRNNLDGWKKQGETTLLDRARVRMKDIFDNHSPEPLEAKLVESLTTLANVDHSG